MNGEGPCFEEEMDTRRVIGYILRKGTILCSRCADIFEDISGQSIFLDSKKIFQGERKVFKCDCCGKRYQ